MPARWLIFAPIVLPATIAAGGVTVITDQQQWQDAVDSFSTVTFVGYPQFTIITNQYADLGITFTDGNDFVRVTSSFPTDGHGLVSSDGFELGTIHMSFAQPMYWLAFDYIGDLQVELYQSGSLLFSSNSYIAGFNPFVGFVSTEPFDSAIARDWDDDVIAIDNIHFGPAIPAPGILAVIASFAIPALAGRRRR